MIVQASKKEPAASFASEEELIESLNQDGRINLGFEIENSDYQKMTLRLDDMSKKQLEILKQAGRLPESVFTKEAQLDTLQWSTRLSDGKIAIQQAETIGGLEDAPETEAYASNIEMKMTARGIFWPGEERPLMVFVTPDGGLLKMGFLSRDISLEVWQKIIIAIVKRNHRLRAPLFWHPCPECGKYFKPERRGQIYHSRACADRTGQRRRYKEATTK